jgi:hypothetical protein
MSPSFALSLTLVSACSVAGGPPPTSVEHIPAVERPQDHFYGAIAGLKRVEVRWEVAPVSVAYGERLTLILFVANAINPHELTHPPLLDLPEFRELFSAVEELPSEVRVSGDVALRYELTPRNEGRFEIPELVYRVYQPNAPGGRRTVTSRALTVPFLVTKPATAASPPVPLDGPLEFFARRSDAGNAGRGAPTWWMWVGLFVTGGAIGASWVAAWRWLFPDAARLAVARRNKAARIALDRLRRGPQTPEAVGGVLRNYLIARFGLACTAQTPAEVAAALTAVGVSVERAADAESLLRECDAARFAGSGDTGVSPERVAALIGSFEGVNPPSA